MPVLESAQALRRNRAWCCVRITSAPMAPRQASLLDLDPGLGRLLPAPRREAAAQRLLVRVHALDAGPWDGERLRGAGPEHLGLSLVEGMVAREVVLSDTVSCELLGPGDLIRPWSAEDPVRLLRWQVRWTVLEQARVAVLDRRFAVALSQFPEVSSVLAGRLADQVQRLSLTQSIAQLNGVDRRLVLLFWHLAERWGRSTEAGVTLTLPLPHRLIAYLVGARRPTVTAALGELSDRGVIVREGVSWLLAGPPPGAPAVTVADVVAARREPQAVTTALFTGDEVGAADPAALRVTGRIAEIHDVLRELHHRCEISVGEAQALQERSLELHDRIGIARRRREAARRPRAPG
jgi:CRP/FNR family cyclic AMP-dependent transcriptional regulator